MRKAVLFLFLFIPFSLFSQAIEGNPHLLSLTWDKSTSPVDYYEFRIIELNESLKTTNNMVSILIPREMKSDTLTAEVKAWYGGRSSFPVKIRFIPEYVLIDMNKDGEIETRDLINYQSQFWPKNWQRSYWNTD